MLGKGVGGIIWLKSPLTEAGWANAPPKRRGSAPGRQKKQVQESSWTCENQSVRVLRLLVGRGKPLYAGSLLPLGARGDFKLHPFSFPEGFKPVGLDRGEMDEHIFPILRGDEAVPLLVTEPFHGAFSHFSG